MSLTSIYLTSSTGNVFNTTSATTATTYLSNCLWGGSGQSLGSPTTDFASSHIYPARPEFLSLESAQKLILSSGKLIVPPGKSLEVFLPDRSILRVTKDGNFKISDENSRVVYRANRLREFNRYINSSDLMEEFIRDLDRIGATSERALQIPIEVFINWLILKAAEADGDPPPAGVKPIKELISLPVTNGSSSQPAALLPPPRVRMISSPPRCRYCGRFINVRGFLAGVDFCGETHAVVFIRRSLDGLIINGAR